MEDDKSAEVVEDTGLSETAETSTEEEAQETDADDLTLSDLDDETEESEESDETEAATEGSTEETEETEADDEKQETASREDEQKRHNDEFAKRRIAEREAREKAEQQRQDDLKRSQDEYLAAAEDGKDLALRQLQVDAYNNKVQFNADKLQTGLEKAIANIPEFTKGSTELREALIEAVDDFERLHVSKAQNGDPLEVRGDLYQYLQSKADSLRKVFDAGSRSQVRARAETRARTDTIPTKTPVKSKSDKDLDDFDKAIGW